MSDEQDRPSEVQPQPLPSSFAMEPVVLTAPTGEQERAMRLSIATPAGEHVTFWSQRGIEALYLALGEQLDLAEKPIIQLARPGALPDLRSN